MSAIKPDALENYVAQHRADFDAHEPRPALWAALEAELHPPLRKAADVGPAATVAGRRWQPYGLAAALALLLLAVGSGAFWKPRPAPVVRLAPAVVADGDEDARLNTAVRGLEGYYLGELARRRARLRRLVPGALGGDWVWQEASLDSSYQALKRGLRGHRRPEAVLTAMNRNLQLRLELLDQQLALREAEGPLVEARRAYALVGARGAAARGADSAAAGQ